MSTNKYIIVTGAVGFIGSCLVHHLNTLGYHNLILVDYLGKDEKWKNLLGKEFAEILSPEQLFFWLESEKGGEVGAIFHLGACTSTVETDGDYLLENNYRYTRRLAEWALKNSVRFIYASSAATYGDGSLGFSDDHDRLNELRPLNMYGYSKHLFDLWLKRENLLDKVVGLKYFNVFGPNEYHKGRMGSALLKMVPDALQKKTISLFKTTDKKNYADGGQFRDFIYVKDVVKMTAQFLNNKASGIYNIGSGIARTWNDLANSVIQGLQKNDVRIEYMDMPVDLVNKYQNYTCADISKLKKDQLLLSEYTLEKSVEDYVQKYLVTGKYL